jgi:hypothetical protein
MEPHPYCCTARPAAKILKYPVIWPSRKLISGFAEDWSIDPQHDDTGAIFQIPLGATGVVVLQPGRPEFVFGREIQRFSL